MRAKDAVPSDQIMIMNARAIIVPLIERVTQDEYFVNI